MVLIKLNVNNLRLNLILIRKQLSAPKAFIKGDFKCFGFLKEYGQHHKAPVLVIVQQKEMPAEIQVQNCFCCCSSCLWQMAISELQCCDSQVWSGFLCTFCQSCRNKFYLCLYWNSFSGTMKFLPRQPHLLIDWAELAPFEAALNPLLEKSKKWTHHFKLRDDEKELTEALSALPFVQWLKLRLGFEGRLHQAVPTHHYLARILSLTHPQCSPAQFTTRQPVPVLHLWSRFGGRKAVQVVSRLGFSTQQCGAASSKLVWWERHNLAVCAEHTREILMISWAT